MIPVSNFLRLPSDFYLIFFFHYKSNVLIETRKRKKAPHLFSGFLGKCQVYCTAA